MMNALKKQLLFFAAMCVTAYAHAGDNTGTGADSNQPRHCEEIKPARPYTGKIPANFKMLALCPDAESNGVTSTYTFVGEAIVDGSVVYRQNDILGKYASFVIADNSKPLVPQFLNGFRLDNRELEQFHLPKLDDSSDKCYTARVKIKITELGYVDEGGTDGDGPFVSKYQVLKVDNVKSHKCQSEGEQR